MKSMIPLLGVIVVAVFLASGCVQSESSPQTTDTTGTPTTYMLADIANHATSNDCWLAIEGKVYDVTNFISVHPGGQAILQGCGTDATTLYDTRPMGSGTPHSQRARDLLANYYIGDLAG